MFQRNLGGFPGCLKKFNGCLVEGFKGGSRMFQGSFKSFKGRLRDVQKIFKGHSRQLEENLKEVPMMFQGIFKTVSKTF